MGAWGYGNLENDSVLDWVEELLESNDLSLISEAIDEVLEDDELDADTASIAIGAAEVLAALQGRHGEEAYDEELAAWMKQRLGQGADLLPKAQAALTKILDESELKTLWEESESYEEWVRTIKELEQRLVNKR
ncbi:MAG: DUF4259 domain-containing protein [Paenibacillus sp.]|uniref:DUF4259 domain-containing protein n=1 Tax=Paenibacillus aquistagni TaxID=1852522 RepID=A0A1X7K2G9_9BACL|nr:DUF4259 domain-containing protein [Paenibacillus aquistagni]MBR2568238.1 DUF4259 domain-containing protein [Paenibacillus sp.]SMG34870.1 protein of unknown function [Paenibacillus aquistagni]